MNTLRIKENFKGLLILPIRPLVVLLAKLRVNPNALTIIGLFVTLCAAWLYLFYPFWLGGIFLLAGGLFDTLDGQVAREGGKETRFGALLDSVLDRVSELAIFSALLWRFREVPWQFAVMFLALAASVMISYARARGEGIIGLMLPNESREFIRKIKAGPMSRAARYFWIIGASFFPQSWFIWLMIPFNLFAWFTVARRCWELYTFLSPRSAMSEDKERRL